MTAFRKLIHSAAALALVSAGSMAVAQGKGGKKPPPDEPPAEQIVPAIGYLEDGRKYKDLRLANRAGDQACLVIRTDQGQDELRGFVYHAATKMLAYSRDNQGIFLATWGDDPCKIGEGTLIRPGPNPEFMDFSPDRRLLAWTEPDPSYTGFGTSSLVFVYDLAAGTLTQLNLEKWGTSKPEWGVVNEWAAGGVHFSPDFATTNEIIFSGAPLSGSQGAYNSLFRYNLDEKNAPRKFYDGAGDGIDAVMSVTNPSGIGEARIAIRKGPIRQIAISDGSEGPTFEGYEPAYSCDNSEIIHQSSGGKGAKSAISITTADGSSSEVWSTGNYRFFDWFCP